MYLLHHYFGKVDIRLPGKGNSSSNGARPVHLIITMIKDTPILLNRGSKRTDSCDGGGAFAGWGRPPLLRGFQTLNPNLRAVHLWWSTCRAISGWGDLSKLQSSQEDVEWGTEISTHRFICTRNRHKITQASWGRGALDFATVCRGCAMSDRKCVRMKIVEEGEN